MPARVTNEPDNYIAFGKQADRDTVATTFYFLKHKDGSGFESEEDVQRVREGGGGQEVGFSYKSALKTAGEFVANSRPEFTGRTGAAVLGADSASVVASGVLTFHRQTPAATLSYYTVEQRFADEIERTTACKFTTLEITGGAGGLIEVNADFVSGGSYGVRDVASALTATRESAPPHKYIGASVSLDGAGNSQMTKFKVAVKRNVDDGIQTNALNNEDVIELNFDVDIDGTLKYENKTLYRKVKTGGGSQVSLNLATGALQIFCPNGSYPLTIGVPVFEYGPVKVNKLDPDGKTMYLDFVAQTTAHATTTIFLEQFLPAAASAAF